VVQGYPLGASLNQVFFPSDLWCNSRPKLKYFNLIRNCMSYRLQVNDQTDQAVITVPKNLREAKDWEDGEELDWKINGKGNLELEEAEE